MKNLVSAVIVSMVVLMAATGLLAAPDRSVKPTLEGKTLHRHGGLRR